MKRKIYKLFSSAKQGLFALALIAFWSTAYSQTTYTFNYTGGQQTIALPAGTYTIQMWGADGGDNLGNGGTTLPQDGGKGGYSIGIYTLASTTTVYVNVGGKGSNSTSSLNVTAPGGYNGGGYGSVNTASGKSSGAGGGGASHVATATGILSALVGNQTAVRIVAGGGGGGGESNYANNNTAYNSNGGYGGGLSGLQNSTTSYLGRHGQGGTQTAGGGGGDNGSAVAGPPLQGIFGDGGYNNTPNGNTSAGGSGAGGGGGGWYGGGAGWVGATGFQAGSGGGGSGYIGGVNSGTTVAFGQTGFVTNPDVAENGRVYITELCSVKISSSSSGTNSPAVLCSGNSLTLTTTAVSNYSWSTGATTSSIVVSPGTNTVYGITGTSSLNCTSSAFMNVVVNSGAPVLSIANPSNNICLGRTVSLTATGAITYTWTNPGVVNGQTFTPSSTAVYTVSGQNGCGITVGTTTITVAPLPVSIVASSTLVCQGYPSTLTAMAAVPNYTWMPGTIPGSLVVVAPVANTLYTVTATDGTCSGTQTVLVTTKVTPTITAVTTSSNICLGDQVTITASGAGIGGSYLWTPGGAGVSINPAPTTSTVYTVDGTNSVGCTAQAQQVVVVNLPPNMNVSAVANKTLICDGQSATLTASGATGYSWVSGPPTAGYTVTPTAAVTVYTVIGSHQTNTCVATRTIAVSVITPSVTLSSTVSTCEGLDVVLTASGATSYSWNGFATPGGSYTTTPPATANFTLLTLTTVGIVSCPKTFTALVIVNPNPTITVAPTRAGICKGETNTLTATGASTYDWGTGLGTGSVVVVSPTAAVIYTITGKDANGCENTIFHSAKVSTCLGVNESNLDLVISVFPNPNSGEFIVSAVKDIKIELINELGQHLRSITLDATNNHEVKFSDLAAGIYFIKAENGEDMLSQKIVITK